jgi:hypothetical protein
MPLQTVALEPEKQVGLVEITTGYPRRCGFAQMRSKNMTPKYKVRIEGIQDCIEHRRRFYLKLAD